MSGEAWSGRNSYFSCSWLIYKESQNSCNEWMSNSSFPVLEHGPSSVRGQELLLWLQALSPAPPSRQSSSGKAEALGTTTLTVVSSVLLVMRCLAVMQGSRKEQGSETPCSFYLESFLFHELFFHSIEHLHASRHFQHSSSFFLCLP